MLNLHPNDRVTIKINGIRKIARVIGRSPHVKNTWMLEYRIGTEWVGDSFPESRISCADDMRSGLSGLGRINYILGGK